MNNAFPARFFKPVHFRISNFFTVSGQTLTSEFLVSIVCIFSEKGFKRYFLILEYFSVGFFPETNLYQSQIFRSSPLLHSSNHRSRYLTLKERKIWFVPLVNPDGLVYNQTKDGFWRKNRRPIDGTHFGV
ncbi:MAG: hypothetical protein HQM08_28830, partial [Candidatus Riflebacteria bacterium]|nr:hypothetical protein [Candidatus Riflebacteria bacterium]